MIYLFNPFFFKRSTIPFVNFLIISLIILFPLSSQQAEKFDASPEYIQEYIDKAITAYRNQNYEQSLEFIRHVITSDFDNTKLRYLAAHNHWQMENYKSAELHFKALLKVESDSIAGIIDLALMYHENRDYAKSRELIKKEIARIKIQGKKIPIKLFNILARSYLYNKEYSKAMEYLSAAKTIFSQEEKHRQHKLEALLIESRMYLLKKDFQKAEISALWGTEIAPKNQYCLNLLGVIYLSWAKNSSNEKEKIFLYKNAKENFEKALYHVDESVNIFQIIKKNLERVPL